MIKLKDMLNENFGVENVPDPSNWKKFKVGGEFEETDILKYILSQDPQFNFNDHRIVGNFILKRMRPQDIRESTYNISGFDR
jgi:hypothetical protein